MALMIDGVHFADGKATVQERPRGALARPPPPGPGVGTPVPEGSDPTVAAPRAAEGPRPRQSGPVTGGGTPRFAQLTQVGEGQDSGSSS